MHHLNFRLKIVTHGYYGVFRRMLFQHKNGNKPANAIDNLDEAKSNALELEPVSFILPPAVQQPVPALALVSSSTCSRSSSSTSSAT